MDWAQPDALVPYEELAGDEWLLAPGWVRELVARLYAEHPKLGDPEVTRAIMQGLITSADHIYHLTRLAEGRYVHQPKKPPNGPKPAPVEVALEDAIMRPLVSGAEAKRFVDPRTDTWLLFPYAVDDDGARLWTPGEMADRFPLAWTYLRGHEEELRARESGKFDCDEWHQFGRNQNIEKMDEPKLIVPRIVAALKVALDEPGEIYCDNVDVGGVLPTDPDDLPYLAGILAAPVSNELFSWFSKPFRGDYLSANKQYIAPLPIPRASPEDRATVAALARHLQAGTTERERLRAALADRLNRVARRNHPVDWLLPDVHSPERIAVGRPATLDPRDTKSWVDKRQQAQLESALARLDDAIRLDSQLKAELVDGELRLLVDGATVASAYVEADTAPFLLAQWQLAALEFEPKRKNDGKRLVAALRKLGTDADPALRDQIIERQGTLAALSAELARLEVELHEVTCRLFGLTAEERRRVEAR